MIKRSGNDEKPLSNFKKMYFDTNYERKHIHIHIAQRAHSSKVHDLHHKRFNNKR